MSTGSNTGTNTGRNVGAPVPAGGAIWPGLLAFEMRYQGWRVTFLATVVLLALLPVTTVATRFGRRRTP